MKKFEAIIYWIPKTKGGRKNIPSGDKYAPIIKVTNSSVESDDCWSAFITNKKMISQNKTLSDIEYLSNMAPNNLSSNVEFVLFEGRKLVAHGIVLQEII